MQHTDLDKGRWSKFSLVEQMANIGSEIERAIKWKQKGNPEYANLANARALELFDLTLDVHTDYPTLKEIARARELWLDFFLGENQYKQTVEQWQNYFNAFTWATSLHRQGKTL